mmetsp:Transcript_21323/g.53756  ORF Transcript_21323/g.53756 Transcript_21323/m.53756 type:complete len:242 (+) Transcript_21323:385-1110(+)
MCFRGPWVRRLGGGRSAASRSLDSRPRACCSLRRGGWVRKSLQSMTTGRLGSAVGWVAHKGGTACPPDGRGSPSGEAKGQQSGPCAAGPWPCWDWPPNLMPPSWFAGKEGRAAWRSMAKMLRWRRAGPGGGRKSSWTAAARPRLSTFTGAWKARPRCHSTTRRDPTALRLLFTPTCGGPSILQSARWLRCSEWRLIRFTSEDLPEARSSRTRARLSPQSGCLTAAPSLLGRGRRGGRVRCS